MEEIIKNLFIGDDEDYKRIEAKPQGEWATLRCAKYGLGGHQQTLNYDTLGAPDGPEKYVVKRGDHMALNLLDLDDPYMIPVDMMQSGLDFIKEQLDNGKKVLVACNKGHSRSATIVLMYMKTIGEMPHSFGLSSRIFHKIYEKFDPAQAIRQFARMHWHALGSTGKL